MWKYNVGIEFYNWNIWYSIIYYTVLILDLLFVNSEYVQQEVLSVQKLQYQPPCDRSRKVFTDSYGEISDGPIGFNYTQDSHCEWLIKARNDSQFITLTFRSMGTECSFDYIFVYDGDSFRSSLLGSFSGKTEPQQIVATSGSMLILLYSDTNYVLEGFKAEFYVSNCRNNCSNRGKCVGHQCVCQGDWIGKDCSLHACPQNCGESEQRGYCSKEHCRCLNGYAGKACSLHNKHPQGNEWHWLQTFQGGLSPRAAHTAVYVEETDSLYVFGGYDLNNVLGSLQIYRFNKSSWEDEFGIALRSRHFPSEIDNTLLKAVLDDDDKSKLWGLNQKSLFHNILQFYSEQKYVLRSSSGASSGVGSSIVPEITPKHDLSNILEEITNDTRPDDRYGHAASIYENGFVIFGGKLANGNLSNELWFYNVILDGGTWILRATNSSFQPPPLTRHTLTLTTDNYLYVFGGTLMNGEFSSTIFRIKLLDNMDEQWEEILPRGGKALDLRVVAHTTVYHQSSNSLIVYGGIVAGVARFSKLSDRMFSFQLDDRHWTELLYPRTPLRDAYIPRERAFHTSTIVGNYIIVFGGYSHKHNKEEICYDNQMYLYHLGCHTWVNQDILGENANSQYPKQQGVFAHAATIRNGHTLIIVGGYHGNVNADLLAYTLPPMLVYNDINKFDPETVCPKHLTVTECLSNPECGWCSADSICYGRTIGANCTTNLQTTRCPGICPSLTDCHSCLIHGVSEQKRSPNEFQTNSVANKLGLNKCIWCVQNARCHHKDDNYGVCGEDTPSQLPGWWGVKGTEVLNSKKCTELDRRPGLTFLKYLSPMDLTMPDAISIINATMVDFGNPPLTTYTERSIDGDVIARLSGFIRTPKLWDFEKELLHMCASFSHAILKFGVKNGSEREMEVVGNLTANLTKCLIVNWQNFSNRIPLDFQAKRTSDLLSATNHYPHSKMGLQHNGSHENAKAFTFEYLEPYSNGSCSTYSNCLNCLSDSLCGWCDLTKKCMDRTTDEEQNCHIEESGSEWRYLTINPGHCENCSNYITCDQCIQSNICEWWAEDARCARLGRSENAIRDVSMCPTPCYMRQNCSECLEERGRCVWCEATHECFSFSVYTSEYQFGICREWLDQRMPFSFSQNYQQNIDHVNDIKLSQKKECKSCTVHSNCSSCLQTLSCGWCFDRDNPIEGICMQGDFNRSSSDCGAALNTTTDEVEWAYAQCPDVDECGLGLHDCHKEAKCTNTHGSYNCHCRRGFYGDGRSSCVRTCYETCVYGNCSESPDYVCDCELGWTGSDCSQNCGCNNHSTCDEKIGKCDKCQQWTEGEFCERCHPGSYGNATSIEGCMPCECNGHGNQDLGICDVQTGGCFCEHNTIGLKCEMCDKNFYGDPKEGGQCYFQCESRGMLKEIGKQGIGSHQSVAHSWTSETRDCLWIVSPHSSSGSILTDSLIQFDIENFNLNVTCTENAVYIYDGLPDLIGNTPQNQLLAVLCSDDSKSFTVEARSGYLTVHYKQSVDIGQGFNAMYFVRSCTAGTCYPPHVCNSKNQCVCMEGYTGPNCDIEKCPQNCSAKLKQGICDPNYGRCMCQPDYGDIDCSRKIYSKSIIVTELFNSMLLNENLDHLRKTLPRFGHSLVTDKRGSLWMFGGYSLSHGALNDIRQFDTKNNSWMQVTVDSTPDGKMPNGRYFHAADILLSKQIIYVYGGLSVQANRNVGIGINRIEVLDDFWMFSLINQRWDEVSPSTTDKDKPVYRPPPLTGHTLTIIKNGDREEMLLIGGFSIVDGFNQNIHVFDISLNLWKKVEISGTRPYNIFGHTTVYHSLTQTLYIFGGYQSIDNSKVEISNKLFALDYINSKCSELPIFPELNRPSDLLPRARAMHSAIATDNYMLIFGGLTKPENSSDTLIAYVYKCNQWVRLTNDVDIIGNLPQSTHSQTMSYDQENESIYIVGGWDGSSQNHVTKISIPHDLCELWSSGKYLCRHFMGCSYCTVKPKQDFTSHCYSNDKAEACDVHNGTLVYNRGASCDQAWLSKRNCSSFYTCSTCLANWPIFGDSIPICQWCFGCPQTPASSILLSTSMSSIPSNSSTSSSSVLSPYGKCVPAFTECDLHDDYCEDNTLWTSPIITKDEKCSNRVCGAIDCQTCEMSENCSWVYFEQSFQCIDKEIATALNLNRSATCNKRCNQYDNCTSCLDSLHDCHWSTQLEVCISKNYQSMYCIGGVCGLVLKSGENKFCPETCNVYTQCATCLRHAHCGWCSNNNTNGDGVCTEGSLESPAEYPAASTCDIIYMTQNNLTVIDPEHEFIWNYVRCPEENECVNNHHNCDPISEKCVDQKIGYMCDCDDGYKFNGNKCVPVCEQGCVRGQCTEPNVCKCDFGYVGSNCSIQCQCNGHSNCLGPDKLADCIKCFNNTIGTQCDKCKPLFVGNPKNSGVCVPCVEYCNGHSDVCIPRDSDESVKNMSKSELATYLNEGPIDNAICLRCRNQTAHDQCEGCIYGHFRVGDDIKAACRPCECHGHGDTCEPTTGEKCNCGNNTESDATCSASSTSKNSAQQCWMVQCSKCRDSYAGNPVDGHQCYKQITVESKMCFDTKTIDECKKPAPLRPGETVFFVVQPRFMNVDIRIIVDVTQGELDLYMSPQDDSFVVLTNKTTGYHDIYLDNRYAWFTDDLGNELYESILPISTLPSSISSSSLTSPTTISTNQRKFDILSSLSSSGSMSTDKNKEKSYWRPHIQDCHSGNHKGFTIKERVARDLSTYVTLHNCNTLLKVYNLKNRLVLTLPQNAHNLSATRFFIVLKAKIGPASYGLVFFRQDQLHIDLFVFFSVFFSCFFLFLAVCVVAWKTKQATDVRRARRRHVVEMLHMAKRPFACAVILLSSDTESPCQQRRRRIHSICATNRSTGSNNNCSTSSTHATTTNNNVPSNSSNTIGLRSSKQLDTCSYIKPIAYEPTSDQLAAVSTVFVKLPGKHKSSISLSLASALIVMPRQFNTNNKTYQRQRGLNQHQQEFIQNY